MRTKGVSGPLAWSALGQSLHSVLALVFGLGAAISSAADLIEEEAIDAFGRLSLARRL